MVGIVVKVFAGWGTTAEVTIEGVGSKATTSDAASVEGEPSGLSPAAELWTPTPGAAEGGWSGVAFEGTGLAS